MTRKEAKDLRRKIEKLAETITDTEIIDFPVLCPKWKEGVEYKVGDRVLCDGVLYKCLQNHTSQSTWSPSGGAVSLWAKIINETPSGEIPDWTQPDSTNPYMKSDKVKYNNKIYESLIDNNIWSPEAYPAGWKEITE